MRPNARHEALSHRFTLCGGWAAPRSMRVVLLYVTGERDVVHEGPVALCDAGMHSREVPVQVVCDDSQRHLELPKRELAGLGALTLHTHHRVRHTTVSDLSTRGV